MEIMRTFFLVVTIWINYASAYEARRPPPPPRPSPTLPPIKKMSTFDLTQPDTYRKFIEDVRNNLAEKDARGNYVLKCSMQKISKIVPAEKYMYVKLIGFSSTMVTLALDLSNAYVIGYMDKLNNKNRAFFFDDIFKKPRAEIANVFPDTSVDDKTRHNMGYEGTYTNLEKYAKRIDTPLGITKLGTFMKDTYGEKLNDKSQRMFLLMAVQMVSEAARFKYISDKIPQVKDAIMKVDEEVIVLENGWDTLSTAVHKSRLSTTTTTKCALTNPVSLSLSGGNKWTFNTVEELEKDIIGILNAGGNSLFTHNYDDNQDNDAVQSW